MSGPVPPLQLVNSFLRLIHKGHLPDQKELQDLCNKTLSEQFPSPTLEAVLRAVNKRGDSAFLVAARQGHVKILKRLHQEHDIPLEHSNADGKTALHEAAQSGQSASVEYLLGEGAKVDSLKRADWCVRLLPS